MRAALYARVSRNDLHDRHGVDAQLEACRKLARDAGYNVVAEFSDDDRSAYKGSKRPGYESALDLLPDLDVLVAWAPDRLTRRTRDLVDLIDRLEENAVTVSTVQGGKLDLSTPGGRMSARLAGVLAEHESELKGERNQLRHATIAAEGRPNGGRRPYGFEHDKITHNPVEVAVVRECAGRVLAGESLSAIVRDLNEREIPTASGTTWRVPTLRTILLAPRTMGMRSHRGRLHPAVWAPILLPEARERIMATVADPNRSKPRGRPRRLLSGLAVCGKCGAPLRSRIRTTTGRVEYVCLSQPGVAACGKLGIQGDPLEELVETTVLRAFADGLPAVEHDGVDTDRAADLVALDARSDEYARLAAAGQIAPTDYARFTAAVVDERHRLLAETATGVATVRRRTLDPASLVDRWDDMTVEQRRAVLDLVLDRVVIGGGRRPVEERVEVVWRV